MGGRRGGKRGGGAVQIGRVLFRGCGGHMLPCEDHTPNEVFGCHLLEPVLVRRVKLIPEEEREREKGRRGKEREGKERERGRVGRTCDPYTTDHTAHKPNPHSSHNQSP